MSQEKVLIAHTPIGSAILGLDDRITSCIAIGSYITKKVSDFNVGEIIVFKKEMFVVEETLENMIPRMMQKPKYRAAREMLYETNEDGAQITKLRTMMLRGIAKLMKFDEDAEALEDKILKNGGMDFDDHDYSRMADLVIETIGQGTRCYETVFNWLKGEIVAPSDWSIFKDLMKINPEFSSFDDKDHSEQGRYFSYKYMTVLHQDVMRMLTSFQGGGSDKNGKKNSCKLDLNVSEDAKSIIDDLFIDLSKEDGAARILNIEVVPKDNVERDPRYSKLKSIKTRVENKDYGLPSMTIRRLHEEYVLLNQVLVDSFQRYFAAAIAKDFPEVTTDEVQAAIPSLEKSEKKDSSIDYSDKFAQMRLDRNKDSSYSAINSRLIEGLLDGSIDSFFKLKERTFYKMMLIDDRLVKAFPKIYRRLMDSYYDLELSAAAMNRLEENKQKVPHGLKRDFHNSKTKFMEMRRLADEKGFCTSEGRYLQDHALFNIFHVFAEDKIKITLKKYGLESCDGLVHEMIDVSSLHHLSNTGAIISHFTKDLNDSLLKKCVKYISKIGQDWPEIYSARKSDCDRVIDHFVNIDDVLYQAIKMKEMGLGSQSYINELIELHDRLKGAQNL